MDKVIHKDLLILLREFNLFGQDIRKKKSIIFTGSISPTYGSEMNSIYTQKYKRPLTILDMFTGVKQS